MKKIRVAFLLLIIMSLSLTGCNNKELIPYLSATSAGDDRNRTPLWKTDRSYLEGRRSENQNRIRESSADL